MSELPWKLKSRNSNQQVKLCSYVVLAEFDIDTGSTVRHQYPSKVPNHAEDWLAENMLPEGIHNREVDYTYIFLNRRSKQINDEYNSITAASSTPSSSSAPSSSIAVSDSNSSNQHPQQNNDEYFLYGVNLCKTKYDTSVRRGAIVKAIAVFSPYHFVEILKVPLEHTLELYFDNPSLGVLKNLYECLNSIDLSSIPSPTNLDIMMMCRNNIFDYESMNTTVIKEHSCSLWNIDLNLVMKAALDISLSSKDKANVSDATTTVTNTTTTATSTTSISANTTPITHLIESNSDSDDSSSSNQNENKVTVADGSTTNEVDKPVTISSATVGTNESNTATKVEIFISKIIGTEDTKTAIPLDVLPLQNVQIQQQQSQQLQHQQLSQQQVEQEYYTYNIPVSIPLYRSRDEVGNSSLTSFLEILGEGSMKVYNAILAKKRVIFVGYNHSAADVAQMVLAASSLVTSVITDIIRRVYPYVNLADLSFLEVSGYIAGATNPMFLENDSWWDIACVLDLNNNTAVIRNSSSSNDDNSIIGSVYNMYGMSNSNSNNNKDKRSSVNNNYGSTGSNNNSNTNTTVNDDFSILSARDGSNMMAQITSKLVSTNLVVLDDENNNVTTIDTKFITTVLAGINVLSQAQINRNSSNSSSSNSNNDSYLEEWVKCQFKEYTNTIIICTHIFSDSLPPKLSMSFSPLPSLSSKNPSPTTTANNNTNNDDTADINNRSNNNNTIINNNITDNNNNTALTNSHYGDPYHSLASLNISSFSPRFRKFYEGNIQRAILLKDIDQIKYAHSCPWQLLSSSLSPQTIDTAAVDSTINTTCAGIAMSNNSENEITTENTTASSSSALSPLKATCQRSAYKINTNKTQSSSSSSSSSPRTYSVSPKPTYRHSNVRESLTNTRDSDTSSMIDNDLYNEINLFQNEYFTLRKNLIRLQIEVNLDATELASILHEIYESLLTAQSITINSATTTISATTIIVGDENYNIKENSQNNSNAHDCGEYLVQIMCVIFSENLGGFHPILSALFSQNPQARLHSVKILNFLEHYDSTRHSLGKMNNMLKNAYNRQKQKLQDGSLFNDIKHYDVKIQRMLLAQTTSTINNREKNNKSPSTAAVQSSSVPTKIDYNSYIDAFDLLS